MTPTNPPSARLLDFTRLLRRAGHVWTGVDRVELAYIEALIADAIPVWGLARTPFGYVLLDEAGLTEMYNRLTGDIAFSAPDVLSRFQLKSIAASRGAQTDARKFAVGRCLPGGLAKLLRRFLPAGVAYLNTGHSNLTNRVLLAVHSMPKSQVAVFIHDVIPLEFPQYQREGTVEPFEKKMRRVQQHANLILYNSVDTKERTEAVMIRWGDVPKGIVAHLGAVTPAPDVSEIPQGMLPDAPYFITVGTIEPRKNHALLLDVWERLGPQAPMLLICGGRGWNNQDVFSRLDALGEDAQIKELSGLTDGALMALIEGAHGLLFPSHAEGFGLPAVEALQLGTPVLCSNKATFREILANNAVYLDVSDQQLWEEGIVNWSKQARETLRVDGFEAPTWAQHFKIALSFT
jgi:glycosyltransferase involved in cell wall biosynthesis